jgi:hypothetical protein
MKTVEYKLLSIPNKEIDISEEYAKIADNLIKDLGRLGYPEDVIHVLHKYSYAFDDDIGTAAHALFYSKNGSSLYNKSVDNLYIELGKKAIEADTKLGLSELKEGDNHKKRIFGLSNSIKYSRLNQILDMVKIDSEEEWRKILKEGSKR